MDPTMLISLAVTGVTQLMKAIDAANQGDADAAAKLLAAARDHFTTSLNNWDNTKAP